MMVGTCWARAPAVREECAQPGRLRAALRAGAQLLEDLRRQAGGGRGMGAGEEIALADREANVLQHSQLIDRFDAFGNDLRVGFAGDRGQRANELLFERIAVQAFDEVAVDLDEVRSELDPALQARKAFAQIVDRELETGRAKQCEAAPQPRIVLHRLVLGQLDDDAPGRETDLGELAQDLGPALFQSGHQHVGADIDENQSGQLEFDETADDGAQRASLHLRPQTAALCGLEERRRGVQAAVGRAADQGLKAEDGAALKIDDGLEMRGQRARPEDFLKLGALLGQRVGRGGFLSEHRAVS